MVGWEFKSSTYQHIHIKYIPRHETSIWTDWVSHCRRCHRRQVPAFPRNLMTTDDPTVTNQCPCFTNKTFKEVRPVTGAIYNTKPNYDPSPLTTQDWQPEQQGLLKTSELFESGNYSKAVMSYFSQQFLK